MNLARILYPVETLGPGKRIGIWFCGCPRRCDGCCNPELWDFQGRYDISVKDAFSLIDAIARENVVDGFTITGGEPLHQPEALRELIGLIRGISEDILVYTGFDLKEIPPERLQGISVLIDGEYVESRNVRGCGLRGSDNQRIHILDEKVRTAYEEYLRKGGERVQNFLVADGVVSVGMHGESRRKKDRC